jgi:serine phosphatase RsbU (regulator of sigma subunit)
VSNRPAAAAGTADAVDQPVVDGEWLQRIQAITDTALSRLDVPDLLVELLERVRGALQVDTAAVLLLDESSRQLIATAARGLEEEVRQGVHIPLGKGFAGRIAVTGQPIILDEVSDRTVVNPILTGKGIKALLGVPLIANGTTVGVMHVGTMTPRRFTETDARFLQQAGDRIALAVAAQRTGAERAAARILARSLIPGRLPSIPGLDVAARYVPSEDGGVGGDWYDMFTLPTGQVGVVIGDVAGHGLAPAVVMGRLRSTLRAYALVESDPATVLHHVDAKIQHFEAGSMATVCYGVLEPELDRIHLSLAGHFPPVTALPEQPAVIPGVAVDPPLGVTRGIHRRTSTVPIRPGEVLCFYTDGLIERRYSDIESDMQRLRAHLVAAPAERICETVTGALIGASQPTDDVALLVLRRELADGAASGIAEL